jgi:hypothetical protein
MPVFEVAITAKKFRKQPDDSQYAYEALLAHQTGIVAQNMSAAVALAGREVAEEDVELLSTATVTVKQLGT